MCIFRRLIDITLKFFKLDQCYCISICSKQPPYPTPSVLCASFPDLRDLNCMGPLTYFSVIRPLPLSHHAPQNPTPPSFTHRLAAKDGVCLYVWVCLCVCPCVLLSAITVCALCVAISRLLASFYRFIEAQSVNRQCKQSACFECRLNVCVTKPE